MTAKENENNMIHVPAGPFMMGTSDEQINRLSKIDQDARMWNEKNFFSREKPQHIVILAGYSISKYPVTVGQYRSFKEAGGYQNLRFWTEAGWTWKITTQRFQPAYWTDPMWTWNDQLPVVGVSWYEACAFCKWLSENVGQNFRLPTEVEWEKAARGTDDRIYPWGDKFEIDYCNTKSSKFNQTDVVDGIFGQDLSPFGCVGLAGNVSDWTLNEFKPYPYDETDGRHSFTGDEHRVIREGSWAKPMIRSEYAPGD